MLTKLVDLITLVPELVPLFAKLVDTIFSSGSKAQKLEAMQRAVTAAGLRKFIRS